MRGNRRPTPASNVVSAAPDAHRWLPRSVGLVSAVRWAWPRRCGLPALLVMASLAIAATGSADEVVAEQSAESLRAVEVQGRGFRIPAGWRLQSVAASPTTRYPVHADLAPDGRLFVVESSGSSAPVKEQVQQRTHRLVVLEDSDGDGRFDSRGVMAEGLMLPQGVLWTPEGVLVATPPEIWRFRDTNGDGTADDASVWFDGKTLTGCANDLHGPFLGRDGWIYWCKGAFAEQTYSRQDGSTWSTRAAHIFRRHPSSGLVEAVMTGGMDNPVEFATSRCGERFFTCTFIQHPDAGLRDALVHAVYGGVYGKDHGVLAGHKRTGPLMPVMTHLGPAAPTGLAFREATAADDCLLGELLVTHFNLQRVTRHTLVEQGAGLTTADRDLLIADRPDFHPTDVLEDVDGSLLIVDTGGWYSLCCPTSHIDQTEAYGGIYRLLPPTGDGDVEAVGDSGSRRAAALQQITAIDFERLGDQQLAALLGHAQPLVRRGARRQLLQRPDGPGVLAEVLVQPVDQPGAVLSSTLGRVEASWALIEAIAHADGGQRQQWGATLVELLDAPEMAVRLVAAQGLGTSRHRGAVARLVALLDDDHPRFRRYAAAALGRIGDPAAAEPLAVRLGSDPSDRAGSHAVMYALIEIGPAAGEAVRAQLAADTPRRRAAALRVLAQIDDGGLEPQHVLDVLHDGSPAEREVAAEILAGRDDWDTAIADQLPLLLARQLADDETRAWQATIRSLISRDGLAAAVGRVIADGPPLARRRTLDALAEAPPSDLPAAWAEAIALRLAAPDADAVEVRGLARLLAAARWKQAPPQPLVDAYNQALDQADDEQLWLTLASASPIGLRWQTGDRPGVQLQRLLDALSVDATPARRQLALAALSRGRPSNAQAERLAAIVGRLGPMEIGGVLAILRPIHDPAVNQRLLRSLEASETLDSLPPALLEDHFSEHPEAIRHAAAAFVQRLSGDELARRRAHLRKLIDEMPAGDPLRGLQVFRSEKAACSVCHTVGYHGGKIGPDLTRINRIRSAEELLEGIVYPSASFVRSYESYLVLTDDGRAINGLIADEDPQSITLVTGIDQRTRVLRDEIERFQLSPVSIMPAGLDQQLSLQDLADLLAFLKSSR